MIDNLKAARRWMADAAAERRLAELARCDEAHDECVTNAHRLEHLAFRAAPGWIKRAHPEVWERFQPTPGPIPEYMRLIPISSRRWP